MGIFADTLEKKSQDLPDPVFTLGSGPGRPVGGTFPLFPLYISVLQFFCNERAIQPV